MRNVFYGAVPPDGAGAPVLVFIHGLGSNAMWWWSSNDDMYTAVYESGYRSAFISMSPDNSTNDSGIMKNAAVLKAALPKIVAYYNVPQVYVICHSMGGVDFQAALLKSSLTQLDTDIAKYVKAVFTLGTPNQGTELADWAFGVGRPIAETLGLISAGLFDLQTSFMASFRAKADPVFASAGIPFYTLAGNKYKNNILLRVTGEILSGLIGGAESDGLVPVSRTTLPNSYAMDLGQFDANHFEIGHGKVFPTIRGQIEGLQLISGGYRKVATGGLGDSHNTWAWSMKWFKGKLYVGTGREINCVSLAAAKVQQGWNVYPTPGGTCPPEIADLQLRAEIWRYTPETRVWERVYQSPQDIPVVDSQGNPRMAARDIGYRGMAIYTEADGTQALYVAAVSSAPLFDQQPPYINSGYPPPRILRTVDGVNFTAVPQDPGTYLGDIVKLNTDKKAAGFRTMEVYKGMLFVTATDLRGEGFVIASANPSAGNDAWFRVTPSVQEMPVWSMQVFGNYLYVGTGSRQNTKEGYGMFKTDATGPAPYKWIRLIEQGAWQPNEKLRSPSALSMEVFNGYLYMGTNRKTELVRIDANDNWEIVVGEPRASTPQGPKYPISGFGEYFSNPFNGHFWKMGVDGKGRMHLGTWDWSVGLREIPILSRLFNSEFGFDLLRTEDGKKWTVISKNGMGDGVNFGGRSMERTPFGFFFGSARPTGGCQIFQDIGALDSNNDGILDQTDVNAIMSALNTPAAPNDFRDLDGDGKITVLDARKLITQCTFPGCTSAPAGGIKPAVPKLPAPTNLRAGPERIYGRTVVLNWDPTPGATRYRVYRWAQNDILDFLGPNGLTVNIPIINVTLNIPNDILAGNLDFLCNPPLDDTFLCGFVELIKTLDNSGAVSGFPSSLSEVARVSAPTYSEPAPTKFQSVYFVRAEDSQGNLSPPSNVVGGPSKAWD